MYATFINKNLEIKETGNVILARKQKQKKI